MKAFSVTPVDARDREHGVVVELPSRAELVAENERLHALVAERFNPFVAALVERGRREIWRLDR